jgi:phosphoenolpyruvate synthase/pyruvate phosphate dikinase
MYTLSLDSDAVILENSGAKGAKSAKLACLGMPVPEGFLLTTEAYRRFVEANDLQIIRAATQGPVAEELDALEMASGRIRAAFSARRLAEEMEADLAKA